MTTFKPHRAVLWIVAAAGLLGVNGLFLYTLLLQPELMMAAQSNLFAMAFILEAFLLLPLFCYLIWMAGLKSPGWKVFLLLSLAGSLAFSIPFSVLLWTGESAAKKN